MPPAPVTVRAPVPALALSQLWRAQMDALVEALRADSGDDQLDTLCQLLAQPEHAGAAQQLLAQLLETPAAAEAQETNPRARQHEEDAAAAEQEKAAKKAEKEAKDCRCYDPFKGDHFPLRFNTEAGPRAYSKAYTVLVLRLLVLHPQGHAVQPRKKLRAELNEHISAARGTGAQVGIRPDSLDGIKCSSCSQCKFTGLLESTAGTKKLHSALTFTEGAEGLWERAWGTDDSEKWEKVIDACKFTCAECQGGAFCTPPPCIIHSPAKVVLATGKPVSPPLNRRLRKRPCC